MQADQFSYEIHNPNNFVIKNDFVAIPFGHRCSSALACKYANIRNFSLPFDWAYTLFPNKIQKVLENNFEDFLPDFYSGYVFNKYGFRFPHFNPDINKGIEEYKRRIDRFNDIMNQPKKIYFVFINEDYYYENSFRQVEANNNLFNEMLELETFIKNKYTNLDYNILYFDFKQHNVPVDSNIINIVLHADTFYEGHDSAPYEYMRHYCGKVLTELLNTKLTLGYEYNDLIN